ncbi:MAG: LuxR C-terminal-related transcriptional regulator [Pseudomonadota bacterium]
MEPSEGIAAFTDQLVSDCGLDTASIFFCDSSGAAPSISYLHHVNVSTAAQHSYAEHGVFRSDPFIRATAEAVAADGSGFIRWGDARLDRMASSAPDYRAFLGQHDVHVIGALGRQLTPQLSLIIGTHRQSRRRWAGDVPLGLLEHRLGVLADTVVGQLLGRILAVDTGRLALRSVLSAAGRTEPDSGLTRRESDIASRICTGLRNKEIAWQLGISEFTVENHLRRIYRKLGIHNRAALVAQVSRRLPLPDGAAAAH